MQPRVTVPVITLLGGVVALFTAAGTAQVGGLPIALWCALLAFGVQWIAFGFAYRKHTEVFFDLLGSLTYITIVLLALVLSDTWDTVSLLLAGCVTIWAARLGSFLYLRILKDGRDQRFDRIKTRFGVFLQVWTLQALWVVVTASCAVAAITSGVVAPVGTATVVGLGAWLLGFALEVVADGQKRRFRALPKNQGDFIHSGLWGLVQHPNYLGEILLWTGIAIMAYPALQGAQHVTLLSPLFVAVLLTRVSGIPTLRAAARRRWGDDPRWQQYQATTPLLIPWSEKWQQ